METKFQKLMRRVLWGGVISVGLIILEILIAKRLFKDNTDGYIQMMAAITMTVYVIISFIQLAQYNKYVKKYNQEKVEQASKELTSEYKPVLLKYSRSISPEMFECRARVEEDGKISCKVILDCEIEVESYDEFLRFFEIIEE